MSFLVLASLAALALLVVVHVATPSLKFLEGTPRTVWLSAAGGVSVAYVFVHFLPELAASQAAVAEAAAGATGGLDLAGRHVFLIALTGLLTFYGLHRLAQASRSRRQGEPVGGGRGSRRHGRRVWPAGQVKVSVAGSKRNASLGKKPSRTDEPRTGLGT